MSRFDELLKNKNRRSRRKESGKDLPLYCVFCKNNGQIFYFFTWVNKLIRCFKNSILLIEFPNKFFKFSDHKSVGKLIQLCDISKIIFLLGETPKVYNSHVLKTKMGHILCPVLYNYICPHCGNTGDNAHTLRYCPYAESKHQFFMFTRSNKNNFKSFDIHYLIIINQVGTLSNC